MKDTVLFLFFLILYSCTSDKEKKTDNVQRKDTVEQNGLEKMSARLQSIYSGFKPEQNAFINNARVSMFANQIEATADPNTKFQLIFLYCMELLNAGRTKESIDAILELMKQTGTTEEAMSDRTKPLFDLLGIAYLRLGEQDNCIMNHNGYSCILPLQNPAIHSMKEGSTKAAEVYKAILKKYPDDLSAVWLLNLASMTLGEYPKGIPVPFRLPATAMASHGMIPRFENIATLLGVDMDGHAGGCCVEDFNGDGYLDILASAWNLTDQMRLYMNNGDGSFTEKTNEAGLTGEVGGLNMMHMDYNNDGHPDVFVLRGGWMKTNGNQPNSLLKNKGDGTFDEVTEAAGIYSEHPTQTATWADFNLDGNLDVFIGNESDKNFTNPCEFYLNKGNGTFTEIGKKVGLDLVAYVKGCTSADVNHDGYPDIYVSVFGGENKLFMNKGGSSVSDWKFEEVAAKAGVQNPVWSFPTWFFDYDNDGWEDIFVCGYDFARFEKVAEDEVISLLGKKVIAELPRLFHNNGNGTFNDVSKSAGVSRVMYGMGANFGDINNDGYLDFYVATGVPDYRSIVPNRMWLNKNGKSFTDVTNDGGFGNIQKGHAVAFGDLDNDGDNDMYAVIGGAYEGDVFRNSLFNNPGNKNHWIVLKLIGTKSNRDAIGAVVKIIVSEKGVPRTIYKTINTGGSFGSSSLQTEIGLGSAVEVSTLDITWPNKERSHQTFQNLKAGKKYVIKEGEQPEEASYTALKWKLVEHVHHHTMK